MKELKMNGSLTDYLKKLREEWGPISDEKMGTLVGFGTTTGCGEQCKITCAYWCSPIGNGQTTERKPVNTISES